MLGGFRLPELLILLFVVLLIFGAKRLPEIGASAGKTIQAFRKSMREGAQEPAPQLPPAPQDTDQQGQ